MGNLDAAGGADAPEVLASIARDYYAWTTAMEYKNCEKEKFARYREAVEIGERLYKDGGKLAMLSIYQKAKSLNQNQIWIISKCWDGIGNPNGDIDDVWLD